MVRKKLLTPKRFLVSIQSRSQNQVTTIFAIQGLISVMGGKWTIYRQMSEDAVNEIFKQFELKGLEAINLPSISK